MFDAIMKPLDELTSFSLLKKALINNKTPVLLNGVISSQKVHTVYGCLHDFERPVLIIASSELKAKEIYEDMTFFLNDDVMLYPSKDIIFYSADIKSADIIKKRFEIIDKIISGKKISIVLSIEALFDRLVPKDKFSDYIINLSEGDIISIDELIEKLVFMGYERTNAVEAQGQFAVRGGIIDLFGSISENAVRIEFWGDEIDTIKIMDSFSQRSIEKISEVKVFPMRELVYDKDILDLAISKIKKEYNSVLKKYKSKNMENEEQNLKEYVGEFIEKLEEQKSFSGVDKYIKFFYENSSDFFDYISSDTIIFFDEPLRIAEHATQVLNEFSDSIKNHILKGYMLPSQAEMVFDYTYIISKAQNFSQVLMSTVLRTIKDFSIKEIIDFSVKSSGTFKNNFDMLVDDLKHMTSNGYRILFLAGNRMRCERMVRELNSRDIVSFYSENSNNIDIHENVVYVMRGSLNSGFEYIENKFVIMSDKEIFGNEKKRKKVKKKNKNVIIQNFSDLKVGDYVVHDSHGIGVFKGIEQITSEGVSKDYIKLGYADEGNLYVAINQMDMVQKYAGANASVPKLNKLGGNQWTKAKTKAKKAAYILAKDLVELYAQREASKGFIYSSDTVWQKEFEDSFLYEETDDQINAVNDIKADMESEKIMDRLICGDVGFGKTEVAIRAAFKAVQDSRQVAYLVPTTILAQQHYTTFIERMQNFPVTVEMMSRFRTPKQQREVIQGLKNGNVDIVIGTHRILSKDLVFKNLGLIIIDEEQRFGVAHKEKMKEMKKNVDVLTLTATPIPRTLHMSLNGIRDMSILQEPPSERLPIQTYVMEYNEESVRDAIHRELARGGQVYYLHNRVKSISEVASRIKKLVPEANIGYAHGQMSERQLENVMLDFMENSIDVLVCTTIIETGLDIPNVNTIIIQDADCMGLAQLYQLRGRVGRSNRSSFAYLMYRKDKVLQEVSEKRLQTIREFTEFGSGFKVAMRDLEIRGAGNLLGAEQHGHMDVVGYDMYCRLLDEAVRELKGEEIVSDFETLIDINIDAYIPDRYINNEEQKIEMYKRISGIQSKDDFYDVQDELEDRFGTIPVIAQNLLDIALMKAAAHFLGAISVSQRNKNIVVKFKQDANINTDRLFSVIKESKGKIMFSGGETAYLTYKTSENEKNFIKSLKKVFDAIIGKEI